MLSFQLIHLRLISSYFKGIWSKKRKRSMEKQAYLSHPFTNPVLPFQNFKRRRPWFPSLLNLCNCPPPILEESGCWHRASAKGKVGDSVVAPGAWHNTHWVQATGNWCHWAILIVTFFHCILIWYYKLLYVTIVLMFFTFKSPIHLWDTQTHSHILRVQSTFMTSWQWRWTPNVCETDITMGRFGTSIVS